MKVATTLIVGADDSASSLLGMILAQAGHDVQVSADSDQASRAATGHDVDLLLVTDNSSGLAVVETVRRLRASEAFGSTPVIVVTRNDRDDEFARALAAGADDYICSPFSPTVLKARAGAVMRTSRVQAEMRMARNRYRDAARAAECGLWEWDIVHDRLYLTQPLQQMLALEGPLPGTFEDFLQKLHSDERQQLRDAANEHLSGYSDRLELELRIPSTTNAERWFLCRGQAYHSASGWAERVVGAFIDVSERKTMESALRDSHRELAEAKATLEARATRLAQAHLASLERRTIQDLPAHGDDRSTTCTKLRGSLEHLVECVSALTPSAADRDAVEAVLRESKNVLDCLDRLSETVEAETGPA